MTIDVRFPDVGILGFKVMERLSNQEFFEALGFMKEGKTVPFMLTLEDKADLDVARRFMKLRKTSPMELIANTERVLTAGRLMNALRSLRPVEKRIIMYFLGGGIPLRYASQATYRTEHHGLQSLRTGLTRMRKYLDGSDLH